MITRYEFDLDFEISSIWFRHPPVVKVSLDDHLLFEGPVAEKQKIRYAGMLDQGLHHLRLIYQGKTDADTDLDRKLDTAVILEKLSLFGIDDMKFIWAGKYRPEYPSQWASQQTNTLSEILYNQTYLGWNGTWELSLELPIFTWIHRLQNLGWIYD
jgi:hypothetical protein